MIKPPQKPGGGEPDKKGTPTPLPPKQAVTLDKTTEEPVREESQTEDQAEQSPKNDLMAQAKTVWSKFVDSADGAVKTVTSRKEKKGAETIFLPALAQEYQGYWWARRVMAWLDVIVASLVIGSFLAWTGLFIAWSVPAWEATVENPIGPQMATLGRDGVVDRDAVIFFTAATLPMLHQFDFEQGNPLRPMLLGMVDEKVFNAVSTNYGRQRQMFRQNKAVQSLHIHRVTNVVYVEETDRFTAYAAGYFHISGQIPVEDEKAVTVRSGQDIDADPTVLVVPYRARVVLRQVPWNDVTPMGLFLEGLEERIGEGVEAWDKEQGTGALIRPPSKDSE
jgi:hypothetical protein